MGRRARVARRRVVPDQRSSTEDTNPSGWRSFTLFIDQGSDGWSAKQYLLSRDVCMCCLFDDSHRRWNDAIAALKDTSSHFLFASSRAAQRAQGEVAPRRRRPAGGPDGRLQGPWVTRVGSRAEVT